jgi:cardiolipin synthase
LSIPNIITLARLLSVPLLVWLILGEQFLLAFALFVVSGISDALDGFIAKRFNASTQLGAYLDPLADKALLVSIYVTLGLGAHLAEWVVITVVSRDILIISAVILSALLNQSVVMQPLMISKVNTTLQIALAAIVLGALAFGLKEAVWSVPVLGPFSMSVVIFGLSGSVVVTTIWSLLRYYAVWTASVADAD